ncbi:MAG: 3'-5' exonuclease [Bacteroidales bacterium]|nr:3'-5' exonuclease [Bacteroidales bacterium]
MELKLTRPIVFFDLETTGTNPSKDKIVEISILKIYPDSHEEVSTFRINPGMHIPEQSTLVHKITDEDVKDKPKFRDIAPTLMKILEGCDIGGYNSNKFDIPLLAEEFYNAGCEIDFRRHHFVDVQNIFYKKEQRTLVAAYKFYCDKDLEGAHAAEADIRATYEVLKAQLDRYPDLQNDIAFLSEYTTMKKTADYAGRIGYNDKGEEVFNFGKHIGKRVVDVFAQDPSYYDWMMKGDFPQDTKHVLMQLKVKSYK